MERTQEGQPGDVMKNFNNRMKMALGANHFLANMLDHRFKGDRLTDEQRAAAYKLIGEINSNFLPS